MSNLNLEFPNDFIQGFIEYWSEINKIVSHWKPKESWNEIAKECIDSLTMPFYKKFKDLSVLSWVQSYISEFGSICFHFRGQIVLIPKKLIQVQILIPDNGLLTSLKTDSSSENFNYVLLSLISDLNIKLSKTDVDILSKLASSNFTKSLDRIPSLRELAYLTARSHKTITRRIEYLYLNNALTYMYMINLAQIGYQMHVLFHKKPLKSISNDLKHYVMIFFPLVEDKYITIIQSPYYDIKAYDKLFSFFKPYRDCYLTYQIQGWNLSELIPDPIQRWKIIPHFLIKNFPWKKYNIELPQMKNLDPNFDHYQLNARELRLLQLIHGMSSLPINSASNELQISRDIIAEDYKNLLRNHIIFRFPVFNHIGIDTWLYIYVHLTEKNDEILHSLISLLINVPFHNIFVDHSYTNILCELKIPSVWTTSLLYKLSDLSFHFTGCFVSYYLGPEIYSTWSLKIVETYPLSNYRFKKELRL